uniref:Purine nucleoside phosphorylase n=1 Tax=Arion vulgaris TaxID=1028688 RepID=A0A0B6YS56_9EUPU
MSNKSSLLESMKPRQSFTYEDVEQITNHILERVKCRPKLGIICGSGLGKLADLVKDKEVIPYHEIPGFASSTVPGHEGKLVFGSLSGKSVVLMQGRAHCYEGYTVHKTTLPVRTMKMMGVNTLFVTNAAGGINRNYNVGDIMIIKDHVNLAGFAGVNPLVGVNDERFGPRFPAMSRAYDLELRKLALNTAQEMGFGDFIREGVYSMMVGPNFETVTECRFLNQIGVDATGMSTVPEVLVAIHCGMRVLGISLVTNSVIMEYDDAAIANHEEVLETGDKRSKDLQKLMSVIVEKVQV